MIRTCEQCGATYDDVYRVTYCPHESFEMNTAVYSAGKFLGVAHSIDEFHKMLDEAHKK